LCFVSSFTSILQQRRCVYRQSDLCSTANCVAQSTCTGKSPGLLTANAPSSITDLVMLHSDVGLTSTSSGSIQHKHCETARLVPPFRCGHRQQQQNSQRLQGPFVRSHRAIQVLRRSFLLAFEWDDRRICSPCDVEQQRKKTSSHERPCSSS
jgi:hypothetical protein